MKKTLLIISVLLFIFSCDDGDFDIPSFVFGTSVSDCGDLILFNISDDSKEALILELNQSNLNDAFFTIKRDNESFDLTNKIAYRIFNANVSSAYFCQDIPPASPSILDQWQGNGELLVHTSIRFDDTDEITLNDELIGTKSGNDTDEDGIDDAFDIDQTGGTDANENGIDDMAELDTDGDNLANYYDQDDDNDGILTKNELVAAGEPLSSLVDADGDNVLDYLDSDNDGVFDYLDNQFNNDAPVVHLIDRKYTLSYTTLFTINNMSLSNTNGNTINYETYEYGVKTGSTSINLD